MRLIELSLLSIHNLLTFSFYIVREGNNYEIFMQKDIFSKLKRYSP